MSRAKTDRSIPNMVRLAAARWPSHLAIVDNTTRLTYAELDRRALAVTRAAIATGIEPGDRVAIWAPNGWEWIVAAVGVLGTGAAIVPLNTRFKTDEAAHILSYAKVRTVFTVTGFLDADYVGMLEHAAPHLPALQEIVVMRGDSVDPALSFDEFVARGEKVDETEAQRRIDSISPETVSDVIFTSGTTGRPKGVPLTHGQSLHFYDLWGDRFGLREGDRYLIVNPFFHCFGYKAGWMLSLMKGATAYPLAVFDAGTVVSLVETERISALPGPPTLFWSILHLPDLQAGDLSSLRVGFVGAASVPAELLRRMRTDLPFQAVTTGYGLTEASAMVSITRIDDDPDYVAEWNGGGVLTGVEIKVVDDAGRTLPPGEAGELLVRGTNVMSGYLDDPVATAAVLEPDGWLHTGDVAVMNERQDFKITDRKKDIFICGGFNVSPVEVESMLARMEGIAQVAVVGTADDRLGEVGVAFVIPRPDTALSGEAVIAWAREHMANYKVPRQVRIVESLPLNATGKVLKGDLRAMLR